MVQKARFCREKYERTQQGNLLLDVISGSVTTTNEEFDSFDPLLEAQQSQTKLKTIQNVLLIRDQGKPKNILACSLG